MPEKIKNVQWPILGLTAIAVVLLGYLFIGSSSEQKGSKSSAVKSSVASVKESMQYPTAPNFALPDLNGETISLSDFREKVVFINFWATWCPPCRVEIPYFIELIDKYEGEGFVVLGVALDPREFDKVQPFADQIGINYPVVLDKTGASNLYGGIRSIPTTFVVNREGKVVEQIVGSRPKAEFERIIKKWL
ncbi:MAG: TlpA family protein disulfide reductase [Calditrichaceae bacterium]|nr:TlpA family protein disulfide reductase [Calditrichaceae bacterium]MBN2709259.1 TlpA family protein disulfide reductase [Calditrichaceae bacterium]RQV96212.1 MAG: TlpA family protein disulfide reductase [Calditrichota bacterium]